MKKTYFCEFINYFDNSNCSIYLKMAILEPFPQCSIDYNIVIHTHLWIRCFPGHLKNTLRDALGELRNHVPERLLTALWMFSILKNTKNQLSACVK